MPWLPITFRIMSFPEAALTQRSVFLAPPPRLLSTFPKSGLSFWGEVMGMSFTIWKDGNIAKDVEPGWWLKHMCLNSPGLSNYIVVNSDTLLNFHEPHFPHLLCGENDGFHLLWLFWELNEIIYVKCLLRSGHIETAINIIFNIRDWHCLAGKDRNSESLQLREHISFNLL